MKIKEEFIYDTVKGYSKKCLECCCGQYKEVRLCPAKDCSLYPFRFGKTPNRLGMGSKISVSEKVASHDSIFNVDYAGEGNYLGEKSNRRTGGLGGQ